MFCNSGGQKYYIWTSNSYSTWNFLPGAGLKGFGKRNQGQKIRNYMFWYWISLSNSDPNIMFRYWVRWNHYMFWYWVRWNHYVFKLNYNDFDRKSVRPKTARINKQNLPRSLPEASPDYQEIVDKPPRTEMSTQTRRFFIFCSKHVRLSYLLLFEYYRMTSS